MSWDWSKAGHLKEGKPYDIVGDLGKETYKSIKGEMTWEKKCGAGIFLVQRHPDQHHGRGCH